MTTHDKDKIIAAAKEAGAKFDPAWGLAYNCGTETFIRFYAIAFEDGRQAEREDCAKVCEKNLRSWDKTSDRNDDYRSAHIKDMVEILARGDMK